MKKYLSTYSALVFVMLILTGCGQNSLEIPKIKQKPITNSTLYQEPLYLLGKILETYSDETIYIMSKDITDATGVAQATGGEIPFNITEMIRSACNRIGKQVVYVPYDPALLLNERNLGVKFNRILPDVMITGAITQYDRTQVSEGRSFNLSTFFGSGSNETDIGLNAKDVNSVSTISFDANLIDYKKMVMIPQVQSLHSIRLFNLTESGGLSLAFDGTGLGFSKNIKYIQGRHDAVRQLVELSVLEIIGKYKKIPYWRALKDSEVKPNRLVLNTIKEYYESLDEKNKISSIQELLKLYGYTNIERNGIEDNKTKKALQEVNQKYGYKDDAFATDNYLFLYLNIPIKNELI